MADKLKASWKFQGGIAGQEKEETNSKVALRKVYLQLLDVDLHSGEGRTDLSPGLLGGCRARKFDPLPEMEHKENGTEGQRSVLS